MDKKELRFYIRNLGKLRNFIRTNVRKEAYDHRIYSNLCGTQGCALGWAGNSGLFPFKIENTCIFKSEEDVRLTATRVARSYFGPQAFRRIFDWNAPVRSKTDALKAIALYKWELQSELARHG